jgi:hypothetical protein
MIERLYPMLSALGAMADSLATLRPAFATFYGLLSDDPANMQRARRAPLDPIVQTVIGTVSRIHTVMPRRPPNAGLRTREQALAGLMALAIAGTRFRRTLD